MNLSASPAAPESAASALRVALLCFRDPDPSYHAYEEINQAVQCSLEAQGAQVRRVDEVEQASRVSDDLLLILGSAIYKSNLVPALTFLRSRESSGSALPVFVWHLENQLDDSVALPVRSVLLARDWLRRRAGRPAATRAGTYLLLRELATRRLVDKILVFTRRKADFLRRSGLPGIEYVPLGHHPVWGAAEGDASRERDIDVLFMGMLNGRRRVIVENIRDALAVRGVALKTNYDYDPTGSAWGEKRNALRTCVDTPSPLLLPPLRRGKWLGKRKELDTFPSVLEGPGEVIRMSLKSSF
jgi:hypothetical protein